jgi:hypothetical protein
MEKNERARRRADVERLKRKRKGYFGRRRQPGGYVPPMNQRDWHGRRDAEAL